MLLFQSRQHEISVQTIYFFLKDIDLLCLVQYLSNIEFLIYFVFIMLSLCIIAGCQVLASIGAYRP